MLIRLLTLSAKKGCKGMDLFHFDCHMNEKNLRNFPPVTYTLSLITGSVDCIYKKNPYSLSIGFCCKDLF